MKLNAILVNFITKVTIYQVSRYKPGATTYDLYLQFRNPNFNKATIQFYPLLGGQAAGRDLNSKIDLPVGQMFIDPIEQYTSSGQSVADSATTNVKAQVASNESDFCFVNKKQENFIILVFRLQVPDDYKFED